MACFHGSNWKRHAHTFCVCLSGNTYEYMCHKWLILTFGRKFKKQVHPPKVGSDQRIYTDVSSGSCFRTYHENHGTAVHRATRSVLRHASKCGKVSNNFWAKLHSSVVSFPKQSRNFLNFKKQKIDPPTPGPKKMHENDPKNSLLRCFFPKASLRCLGSRLGVFREERGLSGR